MDLGASYYELAQRAYENRLAMWTGVFLGALVFAAATGVVLSQSENGVAPDGPAFNLADVNQ
jgi:hypothetical protein